MRMRFDTDRAKQETPSPAQTQLIWPAKKVLREKQVIYDQEPDANNHLRSVPGKRMYRRIASAVPAFKRNRRFFNFFFLGRGNGGAEVSLCD